MLTKSRALTYILEELDLESKAKQVIMLVVEKSERQIEAIQEDAAQAAEAVKERVK